MHWLKIWFGLSAPVSRKLYLLTGLGLMALRCVGDSLIVLGVAGEAAVSQWHPLLYVAPTLFTRGSVLELMDTQGTTAQLALGIMAAWALPFVWVGISMSVRRARDAGISPWWGLVFFVPVINFLGIAVLCALPSKAPAPVSRVERVSSMGIFRSAMAAVGLSSAFGVVLTAVSVFLLGDYGWALFVAGPVVIGATGGWHVNRRHYRGYKAGLLVGLASSVLCGGLLIILALEGLVCLAMVAPLALVLTLMGALLGTALAQTTAGGAGPVGAMALMLPIIGVGEQAAPPPLPVYEVVSEIQIDASPDLVWPNVIGFSELPPPADWVLKTGISTPMRAQIDGEGVGAVRYCEFTTGAFVEPITAWEPPTRLAFDVLAQPEPMHEWSPYEEVFAPHLQDTMMSQRGEFQLIRTADGGTLLRGTTWYTLDLSPSPYWRLWSDAVVHRIHIRVLKHIKQLSEAPSG